MVAISFFTAQPHARKSGLSFLLTIHSAGSTLLWPGRIQDWCMSRKIDQRWLSCLRSTVGLQMFLFHWLASNIPVSTSWSMQLKLVWSRLTNWFSMSFKILLLLSLILIWFRLLKSRQKLLTLNAELILNTGKRIQFVNTTVPIRRFSKERWTCYLCDQSWACHFWFALLSWNMGTLLSLGTKDLESVQWEKKMLVLTESRLVHIS